MCKPGILQSGEGSEAMFAEGIAQRLGEARYEWGMISVRLWHRRHCNGDEDVTVIVMITLATVIIRFHKYQTTTQIKQIRSDEPLLISFDR